MISNKSVIERNKKIYSDILQDMLGYMKLLKDMGSDSWIWPTRTSVQLRFTSVQLRFNFGSTSVRRLRFNSKRYKTKCFINLFTSVQLRFTSVHFGSLRLTSVHFGSLRFTTVADLNPYPATIADLNPYQNLFKYP